MTTAPIEIRAVTRLSVLAMAAPMVISNISEHLLGLVDTALIGHLGDAAALGGVTIGMTLIGILFWLFGFLRMGTTGLTAQAIGARDPAEALLTLGRGVLIAVAVGLGLIVLQWPLFTAAFLLFQGSEAVEGHASTYVHIRIFAAPASLAIYALTGFLIGLGRTRAVLVLQLALNGLNLALDCLFVLGLGMGVAGVAVGTVIAAYASLGVGALILAGPRRELARAAVPGTLTKAALLAPAALKRLVAVNRDIMIRTLLLVLTFAYVHNEGARQGDVILAANAILLQFVTFSAFFLDGFAFAAESLVGQAVGARDRRGLAIAVRRTSEGAVVTAAGLSLAFALGGAAFVQMLTNVPEVQAAAITYLPWMAAIPLVSVACFQLDGIFIGATRGAAMRQASIETTAVFIAAEMLLASAYGNHGLWASLFVFYAMRAGTLAVRYPALVRDVGSSVTSGG